MPKAHYKFTGVGKRKTSIARIYMNEGSGKIIVNDRALEEYFPHPDLRKYIDEPFEATESTGKYDVKIRVAGGGSSGQAQAVRHGVARALVEANPEFRAKLKSAGHLRRDARETERKKYGQPGARKRFQYSKR